MRDLFILIAIATTLVVFTFNTGQASSLVYTFALNTDNYPDETTWTLTRNGITIYSGGPYQDENTLYTEEFCLDSGYCYIFTINDEYGDGICCGYGFGSYNILDDSGNPVISGGQFDYQEIQEFCIGITPCNLTSNVEVVNESGPGTQDGSIVITAIDGTPPYQYSIDGGTNFQPDSIFSGVGVGFYSIEVIDDNGCEHGRTVAVAVISGIDDITARDIKLYPNPTDGDFSIEVLSQKSQGEILKIEVLDAKGRQVKRAKLTRNNGIYRSTVSLSENAPGIYYVQLLHGELNQLIRVVKE